MHPKSAAGFLVAKGLRSASPRHPPDSPPKGWTSRLLYDSCPGHVSQLSLTVSISRRLAHEVKGNLMKLARLVVSSGSRRRAFWFGFAAIGGFAIGACSQTVTNEAQTILPGFTEEFGEFYARPSELAARESNDIVKSMRLNATAMKLGEDVYGKNC